MTDASSSNPTDEASDKERYKEKLRSLRFGRVPGGARDAKYTHRPPPDPSWERGVAGEHRPGGSFMPYVDENLHPIGIKQFGENRHRYEETIRQLRQPSEE